MKTAFDLIGMQKAAMLAQTLSTTASGFGLNLAAGLADVQTNQTTLYIQAGLGNHGEIRQSGEYVLPALIRIFVEPRMAPSQSSSFATVTPESSPVMGDTAVLASSTGGSECRAAESGTASVIHVGGERVYSQSPAPVSRQSSVLNQPSSEKGSFIVVSQGVLIETPASPQTAGRPDSPSVVAGRPGGATAIPSEAHAQERLGLAVIREVLARLDLLPQEGRPEDVLPRFQEVIRLWQAGSRNGDLPPDVVRVVNYFLTSAVLLVDLPNLPAQGPRFVPSQGSTQLPTALPLLPSVHLSATNIAQAVLSILAASRATPPNATMQGTHQLGSQKLVALPRQPVTAQTVPSGPNGSRQAHAAPRGTALATAREGSQTGPRGFQEPSEPSLLPRPLGRSDEDLKREDLGEQPGHDIRASRDKGSQSGSQEGERERDDEEVLGKTLEALQEGGFLDSSTDLIRIRPLQEADVRPLLNLLASLVPPGWDLMDLLDLMTRHGIGWGENT